MIAARARHERTRWGVSLAVVLGLHIAGGIVLATLVRPVDRVILEDSAMFIDLPAVDASRSQPTPATAQPEPADAMPAPVDPPRPVAEIAPAALPDYPVIRRVEPVPTPNVLPTPASQPAQTPQVANETVTDAMRARERNYYATLMSWLNRKKTYPTEAKKARQQGIVSVRFTIDQRGNVIAADIKKGSGYALLDDETLKLMRRASPLPEIPDSLKRQQLTISLPVEYSLVTQ